MTLGPRAPEPETTGAAGDLAGLFASQYAQLVRIAGLLVRDAGRAEEIVQDAFVDLHQRWDRLADPARAGGYLRTSVVNRCRSALRHQKVVQNQRVDRLHDVDSAETAAFERLRQAEVLDRLAELPGRQREVLVLRYYGQLSEAEIAETLSISRGSVKTHSSRGLAALRPVLGGQS